MTPQDNSTLQAQTKLCESRQCELRGIPQSLDSFAKNRTTRDGLQSFCRKCLSRVKRARERNFPRIPDDQIKICSECQLPKPAIDFYGNKYRPDGVGACCKVCADKYSTAWAVKNREHVNGTAREWSSNNPERVRTRSRKSRIRRWAARAVRLCYGRAAKKGIPFGMTKEDLLDKNTGNLPEFCPIFPHIRLDYEAGSDRRCWPSVDRIVPELGYTTGNVWIISIAANFWKSNGSNAAERQRITEIMTGKKHLVQPLDTGQQTLFDI
jgi:hypothetical protein